MSEELTQKEIEEVQDKIIEEVSKDEQGKVADRLNPRQEYFCQLYASDKEFFGNGTQSYIEAYDIDVSKRGAYDGARASAYKLLTNAHILKRINDLLELRGLNDAFVDKQLELLVTQNADFKAKISAIKEYNKLKQRIVDRTDITSGGKPLPILANVPSHNSHTKDNGDVQETPMHPGGDISQQDSISSPILDSFSPERPETDTN